VVKPKTTWESESSSVVQVIVAEFIVTLELVTPEIIGAVVSGPFEVVKV
jgi:hypothetical protein